MEPEKKVLYMSLLLTLVAGFCDTVTFIAADELFSAHVTGNFIVFAYDVVHDADGQAWTRLLSFPVFVLAVVVGRWVAARSTSRYALLLAEGGLLLVGGLVALLAARYQAAPWLGETAAMLVVFAMGLQNTFGRLFAKETYGPTTVMTGNVTQTTLDIADLVATPNGVVSKADAVRKQLWIIVGFLVGCLTGGIAAQQFGLWPVALPGLLLLGFQASRPKEVNAPVAA